MMEYWVQSYNKVGGDRLQGMRLHTSPTIPLTRKIMNKHVPTLPPKTLAWALLSAGLALSDKALAAEAPASPSATDLVQQWAQMVVYAVTPYCQLLSNGLRVCQPIGLVGPAPGSPAAAYQPLLRVPLAPPSVQPPAIPTHPPHAVHPFLPGPALPYLPWHTPPGTPTAAAPGAAPEAAGLPSIAAPAPQSETPAVTAPEPMRSAPIAPPPVAPLVATPDAHTVPTAPLATPAHPTPEPATAGPAATEPATAGPPTAAAVASAALEAAIAHFEFDRAELTEAGKAALDAWLARNAKGSRVVVTGHADRLGPTPYNLDLSRRRAEAARDYLVSKGVDPRLITLLAKGESQPVTYCKGRPNPATIACLAPNRRVVIEP
jgi:outer membrane protein OmpA-like peptidoglycan-associated protein